MNRHNLQIDNETLARMLHDPDTRILDLRPIDAFNGWPSENQTRGGHIPHAIAFPYTWTQYRLELPQLLQDKNITPEHRVILYSDQAQHTHNMADLLADAGYKAIHTCHQLDQWLANPDLPVDHLPRYQHLVPPAWLDRALHTPQADRQRLVICHCHYDHLQDYHDGHIPHAIPLNTNDLESPDDWNRRPPHELHDTLTRHGIDRDTTVVVYGRFSFPRNEDPHPGKNAGHLGAMRCAAIMLYAGVKDVRVLNGGLNRWQDENLPLTDKPAQPTPLESFNANIPLNDHYFIDTPQAKQLLADSDSLLVSVRSWDEYIGRVSGYHYVHKKGRIPGAVFANCGSDAYHMENYRNLDYTTRNHHEIQTLWHNAGITPDKHVAFYCGTGWRASEAFFNAFLMAWPRICIYDGGWMHWSSDPHNPIATGIPEPSETHAATTITPTSNRQSRATA